MVAYLIINLREGDMVSIVRMYSTRHQVIQFMEQHLIGDAETSWWKVIEIPQNISLWSITMFLFEFDGKLQTV